MKTVMSSSGARTHLLRSLASAITVATVAVTPAVSQTPALPTRTSGTATTPSTIGTSLRPGLNPLQFVNEGDTLAAHLLLPADYVSGRTVPVVVVTGAWTTVKEQMADRYARELAARGFAALTFDFRGYGASQGRPRQWESASRKVSDLKAATAFARTLPIAGDRAPGLLAVCFGAGYAARAIAEGAPVASFATVAAWLHDSTSLDATFGREEIARRWAVGRAATDRFTQTGEIEYVPAASMTDRTAAMYQVDYYATTDRGLIPEYDNRFAVMSWPEWLALDGISFAPRISVPTMVVHSDGSALPDNVRRFVTALGTPRAQRELVWLDGNHTQFYDEPAHVSAAATTVARLFARTLR
jgi:alpha-beta hydrolase superfamily lysophospholipase